MPGNANQIRKNDQRIQNIAYIATHNTPSYTSSSICGKLVAGFIGGVVGAFTGASLGVAMSLPDAIVIMAKALKEKQVDVLYKKVIAVHAIMGAVLGLGIGVYEGIKAGKQGNERFNSDISHHHNTNPNSVSQYRIHKRLPHLK